MKDSADKVIRKVYPEIKSGMNWSAVKDAQETECSLWIKDTIAVTQTNRAGLGSTSNKLFSKVGPKGKRDMVSEEVRRSKEHPLLLLRPNNVFGQNDMEPIKLSWKSLIAMEPLAISFLLHSTYDLLPNTTNLFV